MSPVGTERTAKGQPRCLLPRAKCRHRKPSRIVGRASSAAFALIANLVFSVVTNPQGRPVARVCPVALFGDAPSP